MKFFNYVFIFTGMAVIFHLAGIDITGIGSLLVSAGFLESSGSINLDSNNTIRTTIMIALLAISATGMIIGTFSRSQLENYIVLPVITAIAILFLDFSYKIIQFGFDQAPWIGYITVVIMLPLGIGFGVATYEHFRGTD